MLLRIRTGGRVAAATVRDTLQKQGRFRADWVKAQIQSANVLKKRPEPDAWRCKRQL
jgi:hypothetical protein